MGYTNFLIWAGKQGFKYGQRYLFKAWKEAEKLGIDEKTMRAKFSLEGSKASQSFADPIEALNVGKLLSDGYLSIGLYAIKSTCLTPQAPLNRYLVLSMKVLIFLSSP